MSKPHPFSRPPIPGPNSPPREPRLRVVPPPALDEVIAVDGAMALPIASPRMVSLKPDSDGDRKWLDGLIVAALIVFTHATAYDRFQHPDPAPVASPKQTEVEITLVKPAPPPPPPPPPVVQPKPKPPAPIKDAIPPKPKPKPKVQPKPQTPVTERVEPIPNVPFADDAPPVQARPAPPPPPPKPASKTVSVSPADYLRAPDPEYPEDAQEAGWEGKVLVKVRILPDGKPDSVSLQKSSGHASLDKEALRAVRAMLFKPGTVDDAATTVWAIVPISFQL